MGSILSEVKEMWDVVKNSGRRDLGGAAVRTQSGRCKYSGEFTHKREGVPNKNPQCPPLTKKGPPQSQAPPMDFCGGDGWLTWTGWPAPEGVESPWRWEQRELRRHTGSTVQPPTCVCEARDTPLGGAGRSRWGWYRTGKDVPRQALAQGREPESWWGLQSGWNLLTRVPSFPACQAAQEHRALATGENPDF